MGSHPTPAQPERIGAVATSVRPTAAAALRQLDPLSSRDVRVDDAFWSARTRINREVSLWAALKQLETSGALPQMRAAGTAERTPPPVPAFNDTHVYKILDSDVYKWLEAVGYEAAGGLSERLRRAADEVVGLIEAAQESDGYLHSWMRLHEPDAKFTGWQEGHEIYCGGHLLQAAVAWYRGTGDDRLLTVARRYADLLCTGLDAIDPDIVPLHPGMEMALVELYRVTGQRGYLDRARVFLDRRGYGRIGYWRFSTEYLLDEVPVRDATQIRGHAVMALFLLCGAVDVAVETGDAGLLAAAETQWTDMVARKMYVTGGVGSRHHGEAFGDAYELSPDRAYCETCAGVAAVMLSWRLLLATGRGRYAELIERLLYNAILPGISLAGDGFFYVNPLQVREPDHVISVAGQHRRQPWFECACCPPNAIRVLSSIAQLLATTSTDGGLRVHQLIGGEVRWAAPGGTPRRLRVDSDLPWGEGRVVLTVAETDSQPWTLAVRRPAWATRPRVATSFRAEAGEAGDRGEAGRATEADEAGGATEDDGYLRLTRVWSAGDRITLELGAEVTLVTADERVDACRGQVVVTRGPLVYCVEGLDLPAGARLDALAVRVPATPRLEPVPALGGALSILLDGAGAEPGDETGLPYRPLTGDGAAKQPAPEPAPLTVRAVPYFCWGNRGDTSMRVWIPRSHDGAGRRPEQERKTR